MTEPRRLGLKGRVAWGLVLLLMVLHYDFWNWESKGLVLGFVPIGLFYQVMISLAAGLVWALVVKWAWPAWVEDWAAGGSGEGPS